MDVRPFRSEADYDWALAEVKQDFDREPAPGTPEADRFDVLSALFQAYEAKRWVIDAADPIDAVRGYMEQAGRSENELAALFGSRSRATEVLHRKRRLTLDEVFKLNREWRIPADVLVQPYHLLGPNVWISPATAQDDQLVERAQSELSGGQPAKKAAVPRESANAPLRRGKKPATATKRGAVRQD
ncbi:helix-turn-helix domain-containing protein [Plastoroseomonas hellenica]|uniref:helix-turn-helix domain-containing protein n=1 Tax=Plastoroseomonas hellenica TaxID=2687306 RepID=UPI001BA5BC72|nr:hypothetical protein [Plastoroseomonas hellenica]